MKDAGYRGCWGLRILETDEGCWGWRMLGPVISSGWFGEQGEEEGHRERVFFKGETRNEDNI